jgi:hypothetical protein
MLAARWRARYGYLLALHILLWCAAGRTPTDIAALLCCSHASVDRTVHAYREGILGWPWALCSRGCMGGAARAGAVPH